MTEHEDDEQPQRRQLSDSVAAKLLEYVLGPSRSSVSSGNFVPRCTMCGEVAHVPALQADFEDNGDITNHLWLCPAHRRGNTGCHGGIRFARSTASIGLRRAPGPASWSQPSSQPCPARFASASTGTAAAMASGTACPVTSQNDTAWCLICRPSPTAVRDATGWQRSRSCSSIWADPGAGAIAAGAP